MGKLQNLHMIGSTALEGGKIPSRPLKAVIVKNVDVKLGCMQPL